MTSVVQRPQAGSRRSIERSADLLDMYYHMLLARVLDERMWVLRNQGVASFVISCQGHEGAQVGTAWALRPGYDWVFPYYRDLGVALVLGVTPRQVMLALLGRRDDQSSGGRQMPAHYGDAGLKLISVSSPVATQIPQAAGVALATRLSGSDAVTAVYFGDGATSKGDFHEGLNFAAVHRLPVIFICENNGWAISTPHAQQMAVATVAQRACAYGMPGVSVEGGDVAAVYGAAQEAVQRARAGDGPTLIEVHTVRLTPHSSDDDHTRYRSGEELGREQELDPLVLFKRYLEGQRHLTPTLEDSFQARVAGEVEDATAFALGSPLPSPEELKSQVYAD